MSNKISRRNFLHTAGLGTLGAAAAGLLTACGDKAASGSVASSARRKIYLAPVSIVCSFPIGVV